MKISYNAAAMRASNALNASDNKVSKSLQRLSSGLKVTTAKDNPSGYAIGKRMNTQIVGIGTATQSSQNGISVIETADGALTEVHEMLQRMNELAVKGETGTLTSTDRKMLDQELKQLKEEITRIASDTQFNGQTLLDGTFDLRGYTNNHQARVDYYSDEVIPKEYAVDTFKADFDSEGNIIRNSLQITLRSGGDAAFPTGVEVSEVNGRKITLKGPQDFEMVLEIEAPDTLPGSVDFRQSGPNVLMRDFFVTYNNLQGTLDLADVQARFAAALKTPGVTVPQDAVVSAIISDDVKRTDTLVITNDNGFTMELVVHKLPQGMTGTARPDGLNGLGLLSSVPSIITGFNIDATGIGAMDTQTGANEGQQLAIRIPTISLNRMGLEDITMLSKKLEWEVSAEEYDQDSIKECAKANEAIKGAILYVSDARSRLGAYQNRLEHTVNNLAVSNENMTASYSRIMDVDMAEEMTAYTTEQVISQAAVSMLAQANERPAQVLQLLQ